MFNNIATKAQYKATNLGHLTDGSRHKDTVHLPDGGDTNLNLNAQRRRVEDIRFEQELFQTWNSMSGFF